MVLGAILIIPTQNDMNLPRIESYMPLLVIGVLLVLAMVADNHRQKLLLTPRD